MECFKHLEMMKERKKGEVFLWLLFRLWDEILPIYIEFISYTMRINPKDPEPSLE